MRGELRRKSGKRRKKRSSQSGQAKSRGDPAAGMQQPTVGMPVVTAPFTQPRRQVVPSATRPIGPCHFCGEMGHINLYCLARAAAGNRKWYPLHVDCVTGVDVQYIELMYEGVECVKGADRSTCEKFDVVESADAEPAQSVAVV